jgi:hypothetical protein
MKIKIYTTHYHSRHGDDGICVFYTEKEQFMDLIEWLMPVDGLDEEDLQLRKDAIEAFDAGNVGDAYWMISDARSSGGDEYTVDDTALDTEKCEVIP